QGGGKESWQRILRMGIPFFLGLSVYLYLPIRGGTALLNWGNPVTLERFLWHFTGKQFRVWIFESSEAAGRQLKYFINSLPHEFAYVGLILALVGFIYLFRENRKLATGTLLLFLTCVFYSINYDIHDIDSYFLLAYVCVAIWSGFALFRILVRSRGMGAVPYRVVGCLIAAVSLAPIAVHYKMNDESSNYLVEDYTKNMLASFQPNALVLSYQWDFWVSAAYYFQIVKGEHPDVAVVDKELLRRSWYLLQLERRYPWLIQQSRLEVDAFSKELYKFEHDLPYDPAVIQARFVQMILSFVEKSMSSRPVYVTHEIEAEFTAKLQRVPEGLAFRLVADSSFHESVLPDYVIRPFQRRGRLEDMMKNLYLSSLNARATYYHRYGHPLESEVTAKVVERIANSLGNTPAPSN
ncbi:MAG: hypothetical protein HW412_291, partial [Bacteroidetes bacterium]|nr:hypothetical protein [Bacteroidota bacterium]